MQGKDSISFGSIRGSSVWHNQDPPVPGMNNSINFQQFPATSRSYLQESTIRRIPAEKGVRQINNFMKNNLDVVCLLQAAQIKRLVTNLQQHQIKFKQLQSQPLDRQSYQIQIRQLAETSHSLQLSNEDLFGKCQKLKNFIVKQNTEIGKLSQQIRQKDNLAEQKITILGNQMQTMLRKYQKSIESLNKLYEDNETLTVQRDELMQQVNFLKQESQMLKQHIVEQQERKDTFQQERIRQIHRMRQSYEIKMLQNSTRFRNQTETQALQMTKKLEEKNSALLQSLNNLSHQLKITESKFINSMEENKKMEILLAQIHKQVQNQRQKSNSQRHDFDDKFKLFGDEIQRLNDVLKKKQGHISYLSGELQKIRGQQNKHQNEKQQLHRTFLQTKKTLQTFQTQKKQNQHLLSTKQQQIKLLNTQISHLQRNIRLLQSQLGSHENQGKQIHQLKQVIEQQVIQLRRQHNQQKSQLIKQFEQRIHKMSNQQKNKDNFKLQNAQKQNQRLKQNVQQLRNKIQEVLQKNSWDNLAKQSIIRDYEEKIKQYFEHNLSMKQKCDIFQQQISSLHSQLQKSSKQISILVKQQSCSTQQLLTCKKQLQSHSQSQSLINLKLQSLQKQKSQIQKQLQKQIIQFMQNNQKTQLMLEQHNNKMEMVNYQKQYNSNHALLLREIEKISKELVRKQEQNKGLTGEIRNMTRVIQDLQKEVNKNQIFIQDDLQGKDQRLIGIGQNIQKLVEDKKLRGRNHHLNQKLTFAQHQINEFEAITQKAISLTTQNIQLRHDLQQWIVKQKNYKSYISQLQQKIALIQSEYAKFFHKSKQQAKKSEQNDDNDGKITNQNIEKLLNQFKQLNQSLLNKLNQIEQKQMQAISQIHNRNQSLFVGEDTKKMIESQSQLYQIGNSSVFNPNMSFNPSKMLEVTKMPEDGNQSSHMQTISDLKQEIRSIEQRNQKNEDEMMSFKNRCKLLQQRNKQLQLKLQNLQLSAEHYLSKSDQFQGIKGLNQKILHQNKTLIQENTQLLQNLHTKQTLITQITNSHKQLQNELKKLTRKYTQILSSQQDYHGSLTQIQSLRKQLQNKQVIVQNYNQKYLYFIYQRIAHLVKDIDTFSQQLEQVEKENHSMANHIENLTKEYTKLDKECQSYRQKQMNLLNQKSSLKKINFDIALELQKSKVTTGKIDVLNQELQRLQKYNIDLIEELDICKFQICEEVSLQRRNEELLILLVMTFAQIESLRSRVKQKQVEINTIRKSNLNNYKHT